MSIESLFQGNLDVFLVKVRADFDAVEDQALKSLQSIQQYNLVSTDPNAMSLFTEVSNTTSQGDRAVWRNTSVTGIQGFGTRKAGGQYPEVNFIRGFETDVFDPDEQVAGEFVVPEEREAKEAMQYREVLNRAQKLLYQITRQQIQDPFEVFNLAFTIPTSYPTRFFAKGNKGLGGTGTELNEPLISSMHARADGGTTISNAVLNGGNSQPFSDTAFWQAREQGAALVDDVGQPMPMFGGRVTLIVPPANNEVRTALELLGSQWKIDTSDNNINVHEAQFGQIKSSPYLLQSQYIAGLSNKKQWFLADETVRDPQTGTGLVKILFVPLTSRVDRDPKVDSIVYKLKWEAVHGWVDFRNIMGSKGDGAPYTL